MRDVARAPQLTASCSADIAVLRGSQPACADVCPSPAADSARAVVVGRAPRLTALVR